jgi:hypothetical protein
MPSHKFSVGQKVRFYPDAGQSGNRDEILIVVRLLPEAEGLLQYHVQSEADGHARWFGKARSPISNQIADL